MSGVPMKPCPWCGGAVGPIVEEGGTFRWRRVTGCCAEGPEVRHDTLAENQAAAHEDSERRAIEAWNTRATQPPADGVDVSDEMVERSVVAYHAAGGDSMQGVVHDAIRAALTAALRTGGGV